MFISRTVAWLFAGIVLFVGLSTARGQIHEWEVNVPFDVYEVHDLQPFAPADLSEYGNGPAPPDGFFFSYQRALWSVTPPDRAPIGDPTAVTNALINGLNFVQGNGLDNSFLNSKGAWGNIYEMGWVVGEHGLLLRVFGPFEQRQEITATNSQVGFNDPNNVLATFVDLTGPLGVGGPDGIDDDLNRNNIFGRNGRDIGRPTTVQDPPVLITPGPPPVFQLPPPRVEILPPLDGIPDEPAAIDFGDSVVLQPIFSTAIVTNVTDIASVELMYLCRPLRICSATLVEYYLGARYFEFIDTFSFAGTTNDPNFATFNRTLIQQKADNRVVGPQIGARLFHRAGRFTVNCEGRAMTGLNFRGIQQDGVIGSLATTTSPRQGFSSSFIDEQFTALVEGQVSIDYQVTKAVSLTAGYTGTFGNGIARASNTIRYEVPNMGIVPPGGRETVYFGGLNFGVKINR